MSQNRTDAKAHITPGSGDVFADLGLKLKKEDYFKYAISLEITKLIERENLTQKEVGKLISADQARVSDIVRGRLQGYSVERLVQYLTLLGCNVDVHISRPRRRGAGEVKIHSLAL